ncbi:M1 family peptidase, partial [Streptomyces sp. NPDC002677]
MPRSTLALPSVIPSVLPSVLLCLTLAACDGGVHGTPGGTGVHDPYFPKAG